MVESNITQDPLRRLAGVSPSYADGVLICPTGSGCVVAVELATKSLLWGYIYNRPGEQPGMGRRPRGNPFQNNFNSSNGPMSRWLDGTAMIVNGRVLITPTPAEADALYCLNLADGKPAWGPKPRIEQGEHGEQVEHFYIACVHKGVVVLVGRNSLDALNLEDGSKAWGGRTVTMPAGASVCGHGCYAGGQYFVPLSSGEVVTVDLESGKVVATAKSRGNNAVPGNLVCYRGRVISQGMDGLDLYYQADAAREEAARRLAANADDAEGLTLRGEILLDGGKAAEAVADFRRAFSLDRKSESRGRTRQLFRDALLAGLHDDFAAHRWMASEVEPLLDDAAQHAAFFRCMAAGFHAAGQWRQAVEYYLKLVDLEESKPALEMVDRSHLARRDRWVQARLGLLRSEGGAAVAAELDRVLAQRLEEAKMDSGFDGLNRFLGFFGNQPQAAAARTELLQRLTQAGRILEAELLMAAAVDSTDRKAQAALLADMAALNFRAGRTSDAAACFRELQQHFADVPCHAGMTAGQWLAAFPDGDARSRDALRREVEQKAPAWPVGEVEAGKPDMNANQRQFDRGPRFDMLFGGPSGPFFNDCTVSFEGGQQEVGLRDGMGHLQKRMQLVENNGRMFGVFYNPSSTLARSCGHLLVISAGTKICALDPWRASGNSSPVLWCQDRSDAVTDNLNMMMFNNGVDRDARANPFGPVNARYVCYQRRRNIVAADPVSGDLLWVRQDIPPGSELFGDEQYMFVLPSGSDRASVYRAIDGELLGTRKVSRPKPDADRFSDGRWGNSALPNSALANAGIDFWGRNVLTWEKSDEKTRVLGMFDPWLQKAVWPSRIFVAGAHVSVVDSEVAGVLEPSGHFVLLALADGRTVADLQLEVRPQFSLTDLVVTRMGDQYIVLAHDSRTQVNINEDNGMQQPQGLFCYPVRRARIHALDLKGKPAWPAPADVDHQQFLLSQPGRLPVLLFAAFHFDNRGGPLNNLRTSLVAVDRRDGRVVYEDPDRRGRMGWNTVEIQGDPAAKTVRIATNTESIGLTFTDKPVKNSVRHSTGLKKAPGRLGEALLDAVKGAAEGTRASENKEERFMNMSVARRVGSSAAKTHHIPMFIGGSSPRSTTPYKWVAVLASIMVAAVPARAWSEEKAGNRDVDRVISRGLDWLAARQSRLGHWTAPEGSYPTAMTALAAMALLCEGSTTTQGKYSGNIQRAVDYLVSRSQQDNGLIGDPRDDDRYTYGHGFAMLFLSQVLGEEEDADRRKELIDVLTRAVKFTGQAQTAAGGWGYVSAKDGGDFDEGSTTITQVQGLRGCRNAGIPVPKEIIDKAVKYIRKCTGPDGGVHYNSHGGGGRPPITAAAIACLFNAGEYDAKEGDKDKVEAVRKMLRYCEQNLDSSATPT